MVRTTVAIDDALLEKAAELTGVHEKAVRDWCSPSAGISGVHRPLLPSQPRIRSATSRHPGSTIMLCPIAGNNSASVP